MLNAVTRGTEAWSLGTALGAAFLLIVATIAVIWIIRVTLRCYVAAV